MPHRVALATALCLALAAMLSLAACGEDAQLLSGETAREIDANLDTVRQLANEGDCLGAESAVEQVGEQIDELEEVDPKLKRALEAGAERLEEVIATCEESTAEAIGPARLPDEEEAEERERGESRQQGRSRGNQGNEESGRGESEREAEEPSQPPQTEGERGGGEGESTPPGGSEGGEEEQSGGVSPGSAVEEGE